MRKRIFATLLALAMALGLTVTAAADDLPAVSYIDPTKPADQQTQTCTDYTTVTDSTTWNTTGWYVVKDDVTIDSMAIPIGADVKLILMDGKTLTVTGDIQVGGGVNGATKLTIYGQSGQTGKLLCKGAMNIIPARSSTRSFVTLNGGAVDVGGGITVQCGSTGKGELTVNSGTLNVTNSSGDAIKVEDKGYTSGEIFINGGTVIAKSTQDGGKAIDNPNRLTLPTTAYWWRTVECGNYTKFVDDTTAYAPGNEVYAEITTQANPVNTNAHTGGAWQLDSSSHWKVCAACGEKYAEGEHDLSDGICVCGYEEPAAPGHEPIRRQHVTAVEDTTPDTTKADETKTDTVTSAKTFDAGVAVYGAMAVASLLGMGYVGKKRV